MAGWAKYFEDVVLLEQKFVKDDSKTIKDVVTDAVASYRREHPGPSLRSVCAWRRPGEEADRSRGGGCRHAGAVKMDEYLEAMADDMEGALESLKRELAKIRTGRATPKLLDGVQVLVASYGTSMPLNQLATVQAPDARLLVVQPWDKTTIGDIEKAVVSAGLGLNPSNDGQVVRVPVPALTQDRRQELVKLVRKAGEDAKVRVRHVRREYNDIIKTGEKDGDISEDDSRRYQSKIQEATDQAVRDVDGLVAKKEEEVLEV